MLKKKEVRVCDFCQKEIEGRYIKTEDVPNEGRSTIRWDGRYTDSLYYVGEQDYCSIQCLFDDIAIHLEGK